MQAGADLPSSSGFLCRYYNSKPKIKDEHWKGVREERARDVLKSGCVPGHREWQQRRQMAGTGTGSLSDQRHELGKELQLACQFLYLNKAQRGAPSWGQG